MFDVESIVISGGILAVAFIVFAESGLLLGFFLPGDTLLFSAGFLAGQDKLPIGWLLPAIVFSAILGYQVGYIIGEQAGPKVFSRDDGLLFRREYIDRTNSFFARHGGKAVVMARFVPILRTFVSTIAGIGNMDKRRFLIYNVIGALLWGIGVTMLGYWLGNTVPHLDKYLAPIVLVAVVGSIAISIGHILRDKSSRRNIRTLLRQDIDHFFSKKS